MAIYLGHTTAERILTSRLVLDLDPLGAYGLAEPTAGKMEVRRIMRAAFGDACKEGLGAPLYLGTGEPLDLIVADTSQRRRWPGMKCHVLPRGVPHKSFVNLRKGVMVACPELCFTQQAQHLSLIEAIKLAMNLCGIYRLEGDDEERNVLGRDPVMTVDNCFSYLDGLVNVPGMQRAREALQYVVPRSASQMETAMALLMCLPPHMGGFGLPRPSMNEAIDLDRRALAISGLEFPDGVEPQVAGDAKWDNFIMEFQSKTHHDNTKAYGKDYARQLALQSMGYMVQLVTVEQLKHEEQLAELARMVAEASNARISPSALKADKKRERLIEELLR